MTPTRTVSLDAQAYDGRTYHELVASISSQDDAEASESPEHAGDSLVDAERFEGAVTVIQAVADARQARTRASEADTEAERCRRASVAADERAIALANALLESIRAHDLLQLSPGQLAIVETRIRLAATSPDLSHHAVARELGVAPATVSKQWGRILAKLAVADARADGA